MAAEELEAAQKALRKADYESDDDSFLSENNMFSGSTNQPGNSIRHRGRPTRNPLSAASSFDPYDPKAASSIKPESVGTAKAPSRDASLVDDESVHSVSDGRFSSVELTQQSSSAVPGVAGYLEIEEEPPRELSPTLNLGTEPITTSSGLLLTHRRPNPAAPSRSTGSTPAEAPRKVLNTIFDKSDPNVRSGGGFRNIQRDYFEVEHGLFSGRNSNSSSSNRGRHSMPILQARRFLSYVRIWMIMSAAFLTLATGVFFHAFSHNPAESVAEKESSVITQADSLNGNQQAINPNDLPNQILLVPMENISNLPQRQRVDVTHHYKGRPHHLNLNGVRRHLGELRDEFEGWVAHHGKTYHSQEEKDRRFNIWSQNHQRTIEKNEKHGPCKMTKQPVFGSNHFKDLSPEEFKAQFLTGYNGPKQDEIDSKQKKMTPKMRKLDRHRGGQTLKPGIHKSKMHDSIKQRLLQQSAVTMRNPRCYWYDVSCLLRWMWNTAGIQFGSLVGTMEPKFDPDSYPNSVDWRDFGVVTDVRSQGDCGACWAITAVETVESAHAISTGNLYDLSEAEIITCDTSCEMCSGGWPQNAFEWVMDHGGLPLYNDFPYDDQFLLSLTEGMEGTSYTYTEETVKSYQQKTCPEGDGSSHDSEDAYYKNGGNNANYGDYSDQGRYGNIQGYGYATERCICYSDGSGCGCDDQDEELAVGNIATYGPAVVCVEASLWQDYSGGIMTADIGCGKEFLDMNHCVQVVGYAFTEKYEDGSGDEKSSQREGYWIVRNQWGGYWGMNGFAYVAMGENTCGILNDMTQAYL